MGVLPETLDTPENREGGVLVVMMPGLGPLEAPARRSFFSDRASSLGPVIETFASWFSLWGIPLARTRGSEGPFERSFSVTEWPKEKPEGHGPQMIPEIAGRAGELAEALRKRKPRLVIFLSCYLWRAANLPEVREILKGATGVPLDTGRRITKKRLGAFIQYWEKCTMLALPQPSKNTTSEIVTSFAGGVQEAFEACIAPPGRPADDPLLAQAAGLLVLDRELSIRSIRGMLRISLERAVELYSVLEERLCVKDLSGRPVLKMENPRQAIRPGGDSIP